MFFFSAAMTPDQEQQTVSVLPDGTRSEMWSDGSELRIHPQGGLTKIDPKPPYVATVSTEGSWSDMLTASPDLGSGVR